MGEGRVGRLLRQLNMRYTGLRRIRQWYPWAT